MTETRFAGRVTSISLSPPRDDTIRFSGAKLSEDKTKEAMDEDLGAEIPEKIPASISDMWAVFPSGKSRQSDTGFEKPGSVR